MGDVEPHGWSWSDWLKLLIWLFWCAIFGFLVGDAADSTKWGAAAMWGMVMLTDPGIDE